ncbi:hypothetical protein POM88_025495 [Heracleum sosnowskyi]|uniref:Protein kinase domain-containing protein n=1 Tax=Heracleum sosnowskyi TaxID=360622 RepID=A0AAD8MML4_9APIA|nr:hypothetical protein POM88_025495 [Heracleum sosnowskyi]
MELCEGGELLDRILAKKSSRYTEKDAARVVRQMLKVAAECHLHGLVHRDMKPENSMLAAYSKNGHPEECLTLCGEMALMGLRPTDATLVTSISAAADIAALPKGREHGFSWRQGYGSQDKVNTALVDMYAKSGSLMVARNLFELLKEKRIIS